MWNIIIMTKKVIRDIKKVMREKYRKIYSCIHFSLYLFTIIHLDSSGLFEHHPFNFWHFLWIIKLVKFGLLRVSEGFIPVVRYCPNHYWYYWFPFISWEYFGFNHRFLGWTFIENYPLVLNTHYFTKVDQYTKIQQL